jgi:hypothetical protein
MLFCQLKALCCGTLDEDGNNLGNELYHIGILWADII